ncbi:gluconate 2-dehydrogenase subunit 3 family protein [Aquimarina sp. AD1]|uniref:gluconate 2-dehydrogenase subunit 3 family protein n=1 Tax=Aquimarina sp. (strain AD1) TaxID=1714848 RepID=UPI000E46F83F|nr:gluconate 2-dehydrogenase subunit 3 family protein [Aquimarina sp. AD1]AXT54417.1 gluconate 2-dehydrogenase subunit 3 family protein [Aquimarina sp. AD1]RKN28963.1 gluconate 2-dehydrogenase subunit 3 family protein [Aquimarina sp. AD1]
MNRREALKNIGLSAGYIAATPTILSLLQSCQKEYVLDWTPELLSIDEGKALEQIVDLILPETDIPGAKSLHVPMFIDKFINQGVEEAEETQMFKYGAGVILDELGVNEEKNVDDVTIEEYDALLAKYLKISKEKRKEYWEEMAMIKTPEDLEKVSKEAISFTFLSSVRDLSIYGFKTSKEIAENVLNYLPVPGEYIGCDSVENLTGGKDWAL